MLVSFVFFDWVNNTFHAALLLIDEVIYWFASQCYQLFIKLAGTKLFEESFFANFANRVYVILGVFMLFYLAYALLTAIIDPEKLLGKDKGFPKIALNLIVSLVLLGFLPSIFSYAYRIQNLILSRNVIGSLILGTGMTDVDSNNQVMLKYGDVLSFSVLNTFLNPENQNFQIDNNYSWFNFKEDVLTKSDYTAMPSMSKAVSTGAVSINESGSTGQTIVISYMPFISAAAGIFLVYIMISFTLDLGVRVAKFAFYQLLAPIPVIMRILPNKKGVFDKWLKQTLSIYFEVFVRVGMMYISIFFINEISSGTMLDQFFGPGTGVQGKLAFAVVVMGVLTFAKEMPKKLSEMLGIETGGIKLGLGEKLKAGGFFTGSAMLGAGVKTSLNNAVHAGTNMITHGKRAAEAFKTGDFKGGFKQVGSTMSSLIHVVPSTFSGAAAGLFQGYNVGKDAKSFKDVNKSVNTASKTAIQNREKREIYRAGHNGLPGIGKVVEKIPIVGGAINQIGGVALGHAGDVLDSAKEYVGIGNIVERVEFEDNFINQFEDYKAIYDGGEYQAITAKINELKAAKATNADPAKYGLAPGTDFDSAIASLRQKQKDIRIDSLNKKDPNGNLMYKDMAAYMIYNLSNLLQTNQQYAHSLGLDQTLSIEEAQKITLQGGKVLYDGKEMEMSKIEQLLEKARDGGTKGLFDDAGIARNAKKADVSTVGYKEYKRKKEEKK